MQQRAHTYRFLAALTESGWQSNVAISIDDGGLISAISADPILPVDTSLERVALPAMTNVHSHAFQRAFAGLSEYRTGQHDSFWTWRKLMFEFLQKLDPDDVYVIARQLYIEMLMAGYSWVGEFQYLHNAPDGSLYENPGEMSEALIRAAGDAGIGMCLLPVLYQRGGFQNEPLAPGQIRFHSSTDQFVQLVEHYRCRPVNENFTVGAALHSLRAVETSVGLRVLDELVGDNEQARVHIHVAEQIPEVQACVAAHGKRSVEYLFEQYSVDSRWCLIHATHLNPAELKHIVDSQAVVGLCPTTESNLGDGFFPARDFLQQGGRFAIGGDSHCSVDFRDELRTLEYGQRLQTNQRSVLGTDNFSVGRNLFETTSRNGAQAIGVNSGTIAVGRRADMMLIDPQHPAIAGASGDRLLDRLIFCHTPPSALYPSPIAGMMVAGRRTYFDSPEFSAAYRASTSAFNQLFTKFTMKLLLLILFGFAWGMPNQNDLMGQVNDSPDPVELVVLGIAQDAGFPQAGCDNPCCVAAWTDETLRRMVASIAIVDRESQTRYLFDCTPDFPRQLRLLNDVAAFDSKPAIVDGIFLTHAHIGHYTGLMHLGREVMGTNRVPVFGMPRMKLFLETNGPWSQLVQLDNIALQKMSANTTIELGRISVTPFLVPHRDEFSETVGFRITGPNKTAIFLPDIDKWSRWDQSIEELVTSADVAYLDGTFFANGEIPGRDMSQIPHPFVAESIRQFAPLEKSDRDKIRFIHFNHTNPALQKSNDATHQIERAGMHIAVEGEVIEL